MNVAGMRDNLYTSKLSGSTVNSNNLLTPAAQEPLAPSANCCLLIEGNEARRGVNCCRRHGAAKTAFPQAQNVTGAALWPLKVRRPDPPRELSERERLLQAAHREANNIWDSAHLITLLLLCWSGVKCTGGLTVRLLVAGTSSRSTELLGLAATRISNQQGPVVLDQDSGWLHHIQGSAVHFNEAIPPLAVSNCGGGFLKAETSSRSGTIKNYCKIMLFNI
ncbi:hypothetical protein F7725_021716 [Dissostichus mawsoni]|uniref:Uncharacterized protein n=1 Tax=Dissostichus mawsoni TaxID=36200 RepID=A0A7J5ZFB2_DISMA|nr:hypothetical protein F7725_021716 [Dissostichus mawsoni]